MMKIDIADYTDNENATKKPLKSTQGFCSLSVWRCIALVSSIVLILTITLLFKTYIKVILLWLEHQNHFVVSVTIIALFILLSLPISIGYILLVVATGYLYGLYNGLLLVAIGANVGILVVHNLLKTLGHYPIIYRLSDSQTAQAIKRVILGPLCFKIVLCTRLTPIPFGLQNTIFALSNVKSSIYHIASLIGLFPAQVIGVYFGTSLRSMQDVLENNQMSSTAYFVITLQMILGASLMLWIGSKARKELIKALSEAENSGPKTSFSMV